MSSGKASLQSLLRAQVQRTPAQALYDVLVAANFISTRRQFAEFVGIDPGNAYNYLAPANARRRIRATTDTLRRWGRTIQERSGGRLQVSVTEDEDGAVVLGVEGLNASGGPIEPRRLRVEAQSDDHERAGVVGQHTCDYLLAALQGFRNDVARTRSARHCILTAGSRDVLWIEHAGAEVRALPVHPADAAPALKEALDDAGIEYEDNTSRTRNAGAPTAARTLAIRVGEGGASPAPLARALARLQGWWAPRASPPLAEPTDDEVYWEGGRKEHSSSRIERSKKARDACIARKGTRCVVCGLAYVEKYGLAAGFIYVHHLSPLGKQVVEGGSARAGDVPRPVDPSADLVPVCANCHAMLHYETHPIPCGDWLQSARLPDEDDWNVQGSSATARRKGPSPERTRGIPGELSGRTINGAAAAALILGVSRSLVDRVIRDLPHEAQPVAVGRGKKRRWWWESRDALVSWWRVASERNLAGPPLREPAPARIPRRPQHRLDEPALGGAVNVRASVKAGKLVRTAESPSTTHPRSSG